MTSTCSICEKNQDEYDLITLPCGYWICTDHISQDIEYFKCKLCNHLVNLSDLNKINRNLIVFKRHEHAKLKKNLELNLEKFKSLKSSSDLQVDKKYEEIKNAIDERRDELKAQFISKVNSYSQRLKKKARKLIKSQYNDILNSLQLEKFDGLLIENECKSILYDDLIKSYEGKISNLKQRSPLVESKLNQVNDFLDSVFLVTNKVNFKADKLVGHLSIDCKNKEEGEEGDYDSSSCSSEPNAKKSKISKEPFEIPLFEE
ncbi:unnamed protein product [Brachionus calyciflorus]|uniref:Uncharacterized protein n=1 Tax=Brachionus calyciflorus TaxID=104777 RepID=A0A813VN22_9BILA|nr:unnamed protein product [Brachionus calyciflorus]